MHARLYVYFYLNSQLQRFAVVATPIRAGAPEDQKLLICVKEQTASVWGRVRSEPEDILPQKQPSVSFLFLAHRLLKLKQMQMLLRSPRQCLVTQSTLPI